jgi:hypothetical protein
MKSNRTKKRVPDPPELIALRRAAKKALELARMTGTPAYVMIDGKIVDIAKPSRKSPKPRSTAKTSRRR